MSRRRERINIIYDILNTIRVKQKKVKPTHILYKSNLSHSMLKDYLRELLEKSFIEEEVDKKGNKTYSLTEKGYNYIRDFSVIAAFIESYGLD